MLEIIDIRYLTDGRAVVYTMGGRRFKVLDRDTKDGYSTASVEFLHDVVPEGQELVGRKNIKVFEMNNQCILRSSTTT